MIVESSPAKVVFEDILGIFLTICVSKCMETTQIVTLNHKHEGDHHNNEQYLSSSENKA